MIPANASDESVTRSIDISRDEVKLEEQSASKEVIELERKGQDYRIGVITIPTFYADFQAMQAGDPNYKSTTRDVRRLISELKEDGVDGVVMDLRNNGGGALHEANDLVGLFIDKGPTVQIRNANTVQAVRPLNHGQLKITQSKFYRVSGGSTQHKGVIPDIEIPSRIDKTRIGEDALDHALPWDQIEAVPHNRYFDFSGIIDELRERHEDRFATNPEFSLLQKEIEFLTQQRQMDYVSLNHAERKDQHSQIENTRLTIANARRELRGEEPFDTLEDLEQWQDEQAADLDTTDDELDFVIREGGHIMADLLELDQRTASILSPTQFAAKAETR